MKIITVVRDFEMYNRLVKDNPFNKDAEFVCFDNNKENLSISKRYNSFLDNYDYSKEDWFVFCHEDWEIKEDLQKRLNEIDRNCLYGPIGANWIYGIISNMGCIIHCNKDGSAPEAIGAKNCNLKRVNTFDCQCLIIHSSLINKYNLRFDENLTFDLYVEDFCINAHEKHEIASRILQLECQHWSKGNMGERWNKQFSYIKDKYKGSKYVYIGNCFPKDPIGGNLINKILYKLTFMKTSFAKFFYQKKITKSGKLIIKICKIPVCIRKLNHSTKY